MYLKAHSSLSANVLVVKIWVYRTSVGCSNTPRAASSNSIYNNL